MRTYYICHTNNNIMKAIYTAKHDKLTLVINVNEKENLRFTFTIKGFRSTGTMLSKESAEAAGKIMDIIDSRTSITSDGKSYGDKFTEVAEQINAMSFSTFEELLNKLK